MHSRSTKWLSTTTTTVLWHEKNVPCPKVPAPNPLPMWSTDTGTCSLESTIWILNIVTVSGGEFVVCLTAAKTSACLFLGLREEFVSTATPAEPAGHKITEFYSMFHCMLKVIPMKCFQKPLQSVSPGYFTINKYYLWTFDNTKQASSAAAETQCSYTKENIGSNISLRADGRNHSSINKNQTRRTQNSSQDRVTGVRKDPSDHWVQLFTHHLNVIHPMRMEVLLHLWLLGNGR